MSSREIGLSRSARIDLTDSCDRSRSAAALGRLNSKIMLPLLTDTSITSLGQSSKAADTATRIRSFSAAKPASVRPSLSLRTSRSGSGAGVARYRATHGFCLYSRNVFSPQPSLSERE